MNPALDMMHPLSRALEAARITANSFNRQFYGGALERVLTASGELAEGITEPQRGPGAGKGGGRRVSGRAAVCLALGFRMIRAGVSSADAFEMALTFHALGEDGSGNRALHPRAAARPAGDLFPAELGRSYLVALPGVAELGGAGPAFAFAPEFDRPDDEPGRRPFLTGAALAAWAGEREADAAPIALLDLTALVAEVGGELARLAREDGSDGRG